MQIRSVSSFSSLAIAPHTMRMCSCSACTATAGSASRTTLPQPDTDTEDQTQKSVDGDTYSPRRGAPGRTGRKGPAGAQRELSKEDQAKVGELQARDTEVRAHENAHKAAAGGLARGGPNYTYQSGPDGKRYAVGGDVEIDTSPGKTPEETIAKAERIRAAGLAPAQPSGADRAVVAQAAQMASAARAKKASEDSDKSESGPAGADRKTGGARDNSRRLDLVA